MSGAWRTMLRGGAVVACLVVVTGCGASAPEQPSPAPSTPAPPSSASSPPTRSATPSSSPSASESVAGLTLRQLGFENGPVDEFSLPSDAFVSTSVDQPNVVTLVLARPSPQTVEDYLRATLPEEGFTIDARSVGGGAMTFAGNGWTGGFTATGSTSAIVLRPKS